MAGYVWLMVHSGSRNLGYTVANHYNELAIKLNDKWHTSVPKSWELAFFPLDSDEGQDYMAEMRYCVDFAAASRKLMLNQMQMILRESFPDILFNDPLDVPHNYAAMENHFGTDVLVHRKGATRAYAETIGIIPGTQGTSSYIVRGLGNPQSFMSCSHGAGRKMGRGAAQRNLSFEDEVSKLDALGIIHTVHTKKDLDEAPGSYKDITEVMANQADLVEIITELKPMAVIKG